MKTTSNARQPQNIKSWVSQKPLIGSSSNLNLRLRGPSQNLKVWNGDDLWWKTILKILKIKYLSNNWLDLPQISNVGSGEQIKIKSTWHEDNLHWKMTSKYLKWNISATTYPSSNFKLRPRGPNQNKNSWNKGDLQWKLTSKY